MLVLNFKAGKYLLAHEFSLYLPPAEKMNEKGIATQLLVEKQLAMQNRTREQVR